MSLILADIFNCDTDYLLGKQTKPRKNIHLFAEETGLQYEAIENLYYSLREAFFDKQSNSRLCDMLNFILIKDSNILISAITILYKAFVENDLHKKSRYTMTEYQSLENREGLVYNLDDYSNEYYYKVMSELENSLKLSGIIQRAFRLCWEYWIYRHNNKYEHFVTDPFISNSENTERMKDIESNNRITKDSIIKLFSKTHK